RFKSRNFNQASILAECISKELLNLGLDVKVNNNIAFRVKNTKVLNKLGNAERGSELNDAFYINSVSGVDTVIIVDDIYTTGSTIDKLAEMLKNSGISNIYYAAICVVDNL
ncbi:MAG: ComF family protein, partial [Lachnospiraceae bacterium]|nr:ComF family protein [Lachnospiraceae bacterium]